jgi:hypothetical protein
MREQAKKPAAGDKFKDGEQSHKLGHSHPEQSQIQHEFGHRQQPEGGATLG